MLAGSRAFVLQDWALCASAGRVLSQPGVVRAVGEHLSGRGAAHETGEIDAPQLIRTICLASTGRAEDPCSCPGITGHSQITWTCYPGGLGIASRGCQRAGSLPPLP
jgi:hypothetical protein